MADTESIDIAATDIETATAESPGSSESCTHRYLDMGWHNAACRGAYVRT